MGLLSNTGKKRGGYSVRNKVDLICGGREYFSRLVQMVDNAKFTVHLQFYRVEDDETGSSVALSLMQAAQRGVHVYMHVDAYGSQGLSKSFLTKLRDAGVHFKKFGALFQTKHFYIGRRLHHKIVVVDGLYSLVGGRNISDEYNDLQGSVGWLDMALYTEGEASFRLHTLCKKMWGTPLADDGFTIDHIEKFCSEIPEEERCSVRVRQNDWVSRKQEIWKSYFYMFNNARESITIMNSYCLPGRLLRKRIALAAKRGATVKIILAGRSDIMFAKNAERYLYDWMLRNNIEIYEYQDNILHAKVAVCDSKWLTIGSYNINNLSAYASLELNLDVRNKMFARKAEARLQEIALFRSKRITTENMPGKNPLLRLWQSFSYSTIKNLLYLFTSYLRQKE